MPEMTEVVSLVVQTGALGLLTYIVVKGIPALMTVARLIVGALAHQDETIAKLARGLIHVSYKIKNPCIVNNDEMEELEKELIQHMQELSSQAKQDLLKELQKTGG